MNVVNRFVDLCGDWLEPKRSENQIRKNEVGQMKWCDRGRTNDRAVRFKKTVTTVYMQVIWASDDKKIQLKEDKNRKQRTTTNKDKRRESKSTFASGIQIDVPNREVAKIDKQAEEDKVELVKSS